MTVRCKYGAAASAAASAAAYKTPIAYGPVFPFPVKTEIFKSDVGLTYVYNSAREKLHG